jgi:hypothetical protein
MFRSIFKFGVFNAIQSICFNAGRFVQISSNLIVLRYLGTLLEREYGVLFLSLEMSLNRHAGYQR